MNSSEKVIQGLEICSKVGWCEGDNGCPYWREDLYGPDQFDLCKEMLSDALDLLKEQEKEISDISNKYLDLAAVASKQPEIVRCKDCKYLDPEDKKCDCGHDIRWQLPRSENWYCADGERNETKVTCRWENIEKVKTLGYLSCSDAMLKMWMESILTDAEYGKIMKKLNTAFDEGRIKK